MTVFISNPKDRQARKLARQYKVDPDQITLITLDLDLVVIEYLEHYKNKEVAFCQKRIHRSAL
jgi:hypothetical protein